MEQCHFEDTVEIEVEGNVLIIRPVHVRRSGWSEAFSGMAHHEDDKLLDQNSATEGDRKEWRW